MSAVTAPDRTSAPFTRATRRARLLELLGERILVLDGAMGTMLQAHAFDEAAWTVRIDARRGDAKPECDPPSKASIGRAHV